jgi:ribose transport system substrate-binding protein
MGYQGVMTAYDAAIAKKKVPAKVDTGFLIVTKDNIDSTQAKNVLY